MKIISGGQTGVDRAALDAALLLGLPCGGWCPKGRKAEDGVIPAKYPLKETETDDYAIRTEWNVRDSDATLIITKGKPTKGTAYTIYICKKLNKLHAIVDIDVCHPEARAEGSSIPTELAGFFVRLKNLGHALNSELSACPCLNIAGPRESNFPGIYTQVKAILLKVLAK